MKAIHLVKPMRYDPRLRPDQSLFQAYRLVGLGKQDPPIASQLHATSRPATVFSSPFKRARQTASSLGLSNPVCTPLLREVLFDLAELLSEEEFLAHGSRLVRERFAEAFAADQLLESRAALLVRIERLLELLRADPATEITCCSHSFFMKLVEAHVSSGYILFEQPQLLADYLPATQATYPYGKGITLKI